MYAVKVERGRERPEVRRISSGFLPSYRVYTGSPDKGAVRWLVVPGYVFSLARVRNAIAVPDEEWEIIDRISASGISSLDEDGKIVSGPLAGLDQYVIQAGKDYVQLCVNLLGEARTYRIPCKAAEKTEERKQDGEEVSGMIREKTEITEGKKAEMIRRAEEIGVKAAAAEFGVAWQVVAQAKRWAAEKADPGKKASGKKVSPEKASAQKEKGKKDEPQVVMTTAPERPATELEIENAFLREQVEDLKAKVEKLKKALADLI